jgi:phosphosulfolactate synthase
VWDSPDFLELPERARKPRTTGLTHVLDKGIPPATLAATIEGGGDLIDVLKVGWGIAYVDPMLKSRVAMCHTAGILVSLGGTLLEIAAAQQRVAELRRWASEHGIDAVEVSNGLGALTRAEKAELIRTLAEEFVVLGETGAKQAEAPVVAERWVAEMQGDLAAGARWVIAEGRESGTVGLYRNDGSVREDLVELIAGRLPLDRVIFEAPRKGQQAWLVRRFGSDVNLGNVAPDDVLALETLRLGLRADTAVTRRTAGPFHPGAPGE